MVAHGECALSDGIVTQRERSRRSATERGDLAVGIKTWFRLSRSGFTSPGEGHHRSMTIRTTTRGAEQPADSSPVALPLGPRLRIRPEPGHTPDVLDEEHVRIPIGHAAHPVSAARHAVVDRCRGRLPDATVDDVQLIVSELVANVLEHGGGPDGLAVDLAFLDGEVHVQVIGHGDPQAVPPFDRWVLPAATQRTGRGLALVRRLSSRITVVGDPHPPDEPGWVTITASVPMP